MKCALCQSQRPLRNSHIIPEFLYKLLYDEKHRFHSVSTEIEKTDKFMQKGLREKLLCDECELKFSKLEVYANESFVQGRKINVTGTSQQYHLQNIDYGQFKLFLMSLIWRMGISTLDFFEDVQLRSHAETLRLALLKSNPLSPVDYPCIITLLTFDGEYCHDWILKPIHTKIFGHNAYAVVINGFLFLFIVSSHSPPESLNPLFVSNKNSMTIFKKDIRNIPYLREAAFELGSAIHKRKTSKVN